MTRKTAFLVILSLFVIFVGYSSVNIFPSYGLYQEPNSTFIFCTPLNHIGWHKNILPWIDGLIYTIVPSSIMIVSNISIIWKLRQTMKQRRFMTNTESNEDNKGYGGNRIAVMLICVSTFFVLTTMPFGIFFIGGYSGSENRSP